ncbi:MAG: DUF559 domain-containing protein [Chitinophagales bacterium]
MKSITDICRELRRNETKSEAILWSHLRSKQFSGLKFRRQHAIAYQNIQGRRNYFIADFYCAEKRIIIELDGEIHDFQKEYDSNRDMILKQLKLKTLRIKNEALEEDLEHVLKQIKEFAGL